jgi:hypothetical protein
MVIETGTETHQGRLVVENKASIKTVVPIKQPMKSK